VVGSPLKILELINVFCTNVLNVHRILTDKTHTKVYGSQTDYRKSNYIGDQAFQDKLKDLLTEIIRMIKQFE